MEPFGSLVAAVVRGGLVLLDPATGRADLYDRARGTTCGDDRCLAVRGSLLWCVGRGVTLFESRELRPD